ncbi:MAG: putative Ig domain-containing protein, partial [Candidatus Kapaibacterium sp.]
VAEQGKEAVVFKIQSDKEGKFFAKIGLVNKCTGEIVSKMALGICYGDCDNNPPAGMYFASELQSIILNEKGMADKQIKIINDTKCEFEVIVLESKVKIDVSEQDENSAKINLTAQEKGRYKSVIGLKNVCTGELVSRMVLDICWGDCNTNEPGLYFEKGTEFTHKLEAGVSWRYDVNAVSKEECRLTYHLSDDTGHGNTPDGLELDEETGVLTWENPVRGEYKVPVIVRSTCDGGATYTQITGLFYIIVKGDNPNYSSTLMCTFYDETDVLIDFVFKVTV